MDRPGRVRGQLAERGSNSVPPLAHSDPPAVLTTVASRRLAAVAKRGWRVGLTGC